MVGGLEERDVNTEQKVLGTNWKYFTDEFLFKFQTHVETAQGPMPTKRNVLKVIARFYDPMGLILPIIVQMKILLQDICKANYHWDAELDSELKARWIKLISELGQVNVIQVPRCVTSEPDSKERISTQVRLIASKTRVTRLKKQTIPRLELLAGVNTGNVDCTDHEYTRTVSLYQPCLLLDRLEECSVLVQGER